MMRRPAMLVLVLLVAGVAAAASPPTALLGRPTATSVTVSVLSPVDATLALEYRLAGASEWARSEPFAAPGGIPVERAVEGLEADREYEYRIVGDGVTSDFHRFHTQRPGGTAFTFAVEADPHLDENSSGELFARSLGNALARRPDFLFDLGDTFMTEKLAPSRDGALERHRLLRSYFDLAGHSFPLFLVMGNHEGEAGWLDDGGGDNIAVWATSVRKQYFPNPEPDAFYDGDATAYPFVGLRQATYAFEWGDALFVALDPFWNTKVKGGGQWSWTLGREQYDWLRGVLAASRARFKFVFIHHLVGGVDQARGGVEAAPFYEWGGRNADGTDGFGEHRPGWGKPIHQLLVDAGVTIVFHGHDHLFARQELDGIVYQEVPQPGWPGLRLPDAARYGYVSGVILPSSGNLLVTVAPDHVTVDYVRAILPADEIPGRGNGEVVYSYRVEGTAVPPDPRRRAVRR